MSQYREPMLTVSEVAERLGVTTRQARRLVAAHKDAIHDGLRWILPARRLPDLVGRNTTPGRPKKSGTR